MIKCMFKVVASVFNMDSANEHCHSSIAGSSFIYPNNGLNARHNVGYTSLNEYTVRGRFYMGTYFLTYGADVNLCSTDAIR